MVVKQKPEAISQSCVLLTRRSLVCFTTHVTSTVGSFAAPSGSSGAGELLQLMLDGTPRTRAELIRMTGLARSTVGARLDALLAAGLLTPSGEAASTGGRPPARLAFNPDAGVVIGADLGATHALVALTDLSGRVLAEKALRLDIATGPEPVLDRVARAGRAPLSASACPARSSTRPGGPCYRRSCRAGTTTTSRGTSAAPSAPRCSSTTTS